jgi:capsid portal protein
LPYPADGKTKDGVSYLLHFKRNSQDNIYYGSPDYSHLHDLIKQSYLSDQYNINFFSNGGQPSWAVLVTGGKLSKRGQEAIQEYLNNDMKGVANAHKMLFLSFQNEKAQVKLVPLSKSIDEQFITLNEKVRFQITLKCHVMPKMVGISQGGNFGGGSAGVADMQMYIETVARPEQQYIEDVLNQFFSLEFGVNPEIVFNSMDISNEKDDAIIANLYWNMVDEHGNRVLDVNEIRTRYLHLKPIDLVHTSENEEELDDTMSVNAQGKPRSSSGNMDAGERGDINNLNPEKNKR